jgi:hypothetical protein
MKNLVLVLLALLFVNFATANTITVVNTNNSGSGSLREAVDDAQANDTIRFDPSLISAGSDSIVLATTILFNKSLVFKGLYNSMDTLYISGGNTNRHFYIVYAGIVTMDSMVLVNGNAGSGDGGAILINDSGSLFIHNSFITGNNGNNGGGISSFNNSGASAHVEIQNSSITNNTASSNGGGISSYSYSSSSYSSTSIQITNSTISGNTANGAFGGGGGIYSFSLSQASMILSSSSSVQVSNSTIIGNNANSGNGGGVYSLSSPSISASTIEITSSIIWTASTGGANFYNNAASITSNGYNIFSDAPNGYNSSLDLVNVSAVSLNLQPLANNGGSTPTMLPGCGSVAINAGSPTDFSAAQNGLITDSRRDIGAAESPSSPPSSSSFSVSECSSYTVPSGNQTISGPTTQIINDTIPNACGGDSVMTITVNFGNQTRIVMNTNDSGVNSLRQIVNDACSGDTIRFDPSLISAGSDSIVLTSHISFSKPLVFKGLYNSMDTLFISGGNTNRHFDISNAGNVAMDSMVLVNGNSASGAGGAIYFYNSDTLFVYNSLVSNNKATWGAGICSYNVSGLGAFIEVHNSIIKNNKASVAGGAIYSLSSSSSSSSSSVLVSNSSISGNSANSGGGIYTSSPSSSFLQVTNSTISGNSANNHGGGVFSNSQVTSFYSVQLANSTISGNTANVNGGGIYSSSTSISPPSFQIINSTISGNSANNDGGGIYSSSASYYSPSSIQLTNSSIIGNSANNDGGGISSSSTLVTLESSIIWTALSGGGNIDNNGSPIISNGYNIFSDAPNGYNSALDSVNVSTVSLNLQPLANNGGSTQTMLPGCGSVAINAGGPTDFSAAQNGLITDSRRDIGAAESPSLPLSSSSFSVSECSSYTVPSGNLTISGPNTQIINDTIPNACGGDSIMTITVNFGNQTRIVMNTNNSGVNSLRQIVADACSGDTIRFDPSLISSGSDSIVLTSDIAFSKSLIFKGFIIVQIPYL